MNLELNFDWNEATEYLVLINYYHGDIEWRRRIVFPHIIYSKDMPEREPFNAVNQAKSETNLLKFIYEFYDRLPRNVINVHQYEHKSYTHDGSIVDILNDPLFEQKYIESNTNGYWNFCSYILGHAGPQVERMTQCGWWSECMKPWFGDIQGFHDFTFMKRGCAQFVVSQDRIRSLPKEFYKNMYDWLVAKSTGPSRGFDGHDGPFSNIWTSRYMEWTWELIFTVYKPTENTLHAVNERKDLRLLALYGADSYQIDVTRRLLQQYQTDVNTLTINNDLSFNQCFGDPICNIAKQLCISMMFDDGRRVKHCIPEKHSSLTILLL